MNRSYNLPTKYRPHGYVQKSSDSDTTNNHYYYQKILLLFLALLQVLPEFLLHFPRQHIYFFPIINTSIIRIQTYIPIIFVCTSNL